MFHDCLPLYDQQRTLYTFKEIAGVENGPFDVNTPNGRCIQISVDLIGKMRIRPDHNISTPSYKFLSAVVNRNLEGSFIKSKHKISYFCLKIEQSKSFDPKGKSSVFNILKNNI